MKIKIINRFDGSIIFEHECENNTFKLTARSAVSLKVSLSYADLSSTNLSSANLRYADLRYANLRYADLNSADLNSADLSSADLSSANLRYANLRSANLRSADLRYANLDFSCLGLSCKTFGVKWDSRHIFQFIAHITRAEQINLDDDARAALAALDQWKNKFCEYRHDVKKI